jgi:hypothetical protein
MTARVIAPTLSLRAPAVNLRGSERGQREESLAGDGGMFGALVSSERAIARGRR